MDTRLVIGAALAISTAVAPMALAADAGYYLPRKPLPKLPTEKLDIPVDRHGNIVATGRLVVKFHDSVRARTSTQRGRALHSLASENVRGVEDILGARRLTIRQAITVEPARLRAVEERAMERTGRLQPDLAGLMYVEGPLNDLLEAARALNELPIVEWVEFEQEMVYHVPVPAPLGEPPQCGDAAAGDCFDPLNGTLACADEVCCQQVGQINPFCIDEDLGGVWDLLCVNFANLICQDGDRCQTQLVNGNCFEVHPNPGCSNPDCCNTVGSFDPFCIEVAWDVTCVNLASQLCASATSDCCIANGTPGCEDAACELVVCAQIPSCCDTLWDAECAVLAQAECGVCDVVPTPDFSMDSEDPSTRFQKYTTREPSLPGDAFFDATGFTGDGLALYGGPNTLEGLGQILLEQYGVGEANGARGLGVKVGVIEHSAFVTGVKGGEEWHEDLFDVIPEPNQTIITITGGVLSPDHGTAVLGQIVGAHNGSGVAGIARDAEGYFFPIVSIEEGGRILNAIFSALETFSEGDVLNYSIGPGGGGTLVTAPGIWTLVRLGTDLGITSVISAGNSCENIDGNAQAGGEDSGAILVGACYPGTPIPPFPGGLGRFCRLGFSNHCRECEGANVVHISAWGSNVATAGYGGLFNPPNAAGTGINKARAYTATFGGTSAAAPIIAGLVACLQGLSNQFYGTFLTPEAIRELLAVENYDPATGTKIPQCDSPAPQNLPGAPEVAPCAPDLDPESDARLIGGFPKPFELGISVITGNFFSGSPLTDVKVITGQLVFGNINSLKAVDGNTLRVNSRRKPPGSQGAGTPPALVYLTAGETTDIEVTAATFLPQDEVVQLVAQAVVSATTDFVLMAMYVYNYVESRWTFIPELVFIGPGGGEINAGLLEPYNHVSPQGQMKARVWTCGLGNVPRHQVLYDFVSVRPFPIADPGPADP